jgi:hypothetical protein
VVPAETPVTTPDVEITATDTLPELHEPPGAASDKIAELPTHRLELPVIKPAFGNGFTVTVYSADAEPQLPVSV